MLSSFRLSTITICIISALSLCITSVFSQSATYSGKIVDKSSKEAIPFVHIMQLNGKVSGVADMKGHFTLTITKGIEEIRFSCMGYKSKTVTVNGDFSNRVIELEQDVIVLETVDIKPLDALGIFREAMERIPENYGMDTSSISGYYLNFTELGEQNLRYTEAFIDIYRPPYLPNAHKKHLVGDSITVKEVRTKPSEIDDWKIMAVTPWELGIHLLQGRDVARDFSSSVMAAGFLDSYRFDLEDMVSFEGRPTYKFKLEPKKNQKNGIWHGNIFIDEETKAFTKWDVWSDKKLFKKVTSNAGYFLMTNLYKFHYKEGEWREAFQYKLKDGVWYLDEVNSGKHFIVNSKKRDMDQLPLVQKLHYKTAAFNQKVVLPDVDFLPHDPGKAGKLFEQNYRPEFWRVFDESRGKEPDERAYGLRTNFPETKPYQFSKLDTLKGTLTPLRTAFDVGYYHLDVAVFPEKEEIQGSSLIRFKVVEPTEKIQIDLYSGMYIDSIIHQGKSLAFEREFDAVYVSFGEQLQKNNIEEIKVYFGGRPLDFDPLTPMYASFLWFSDDNGHPWMQAICQGYGASGWWPNKDHLSDEPDSVSISITNPSDLVAVSNGRLRNKETLANGKTRTTWHVSYPINNYNLTLNIGKYEQVSKLFPVQEGELDVEYHVMEYHVQNIDSKFGVTEKALRTFEKYFGPYPFSRDGIKFIETPHAMEHQSAVALGPEYFQDRKSNQKGKSDFARGELPDQILLHEFAHEWWGNSLSCEDNAELWIHEAFATYAEALYIEEQYSYEEALVYLNALKPSILNKQPLIGHFGVNHIHYNIWDMYAKGALFLNTLRHVINNDTLWFEIIYGLSTEFRYQRITTEQVQAYFNQKSGIDLDPIFDQYLRSTEIPVLEVQTEGGALKYRWKTNIFGFAMPVSYQLEKGELHWIHPHTAWQVLELGSSNTDDMHFHTDRFYFQTP